MWTELARSGCDDPAAFLNGDVRRLIAVPGKRCVHDPIRSEPRVEATVGTVPRKREAMFPAVEVGGDERVPLVIDRNPCCIPFGAIDPRHDAAIPPERGVKFAVREVP